MAYKITHTAYAGAPATVMTYRRRDHAANAIFRLVYDTVRSLAGLDTRWGWEASSISRVIAAELERGVDSGFKRQVTVQGETFLVERT